MSSRQLPLVAAVALVGVALLLALLARDVRAWHETVSEGDRAFHARPADPTLWKVEAPALGGVSKRLLGLEEDLRLRRAAQLERRSRPRAGLQRTAKELSFATAAQVILGELQRGDHAADLRSTAANELGVLALVDALADPTQSQLLTKRAVQKFTEATKLDPANEAARLNLELVLTLLETGDPRIKSVEEQGDVGPNTGAGSGTSGSGL